MDIRQQVGLNVQRIRRTRGWSQEELAFESGLHRTYISGIERGARNPTVTVLKELADALGVSPGVLLDSQHLPPSG
ncbi:MULTISPECIES: helix-turn-helix domain-containing protein [Azospirillum]|uniref:XRE family transcriptional regulator n=1 Tax=Azospirillum brasilense TaxID=192 RepID=A0A4D8Q6X9_AZOBR|nr:MULTISPECIES: helix-turn-helix transcriptional regulator [Azospirillum]MBF5093834.1 helix-turn-helix transcriptional regulator [Azospirillum sp. INR13]MBK3777631.1 helix-turn-helix domain-containing protein [Azospirillum brasilense]QCO05808.1 XRE family transcriptional regulator [Azospirillum argentinense]